MANPHQIYRDAIDPIAAKTEEVKKEEALQNEQTALQGWEAWRNLPQTQEFLRIIQIVINEKAFGKQIEIEGRKEYSVGIAQAAMLSAGSINNDFIRSRLVEIATLQNVLGVAFTGKY